MKYLEAATVGVLWEKGVFKNLANFRPATSLKKRLQHRCFPVNLLNFQEHLFYRTPPGDCFLVLFQAGTSAGD